LVAKFCSCDAELRADHFCRFGACAAHGFAKQAGR
jgi:hypothetical protein